jgi:hypothetical protein
MVHDTTTEDSDLGSFTTATYSNDIPKIEWNLPAFLLSQALLLLHIGAPMIGQPV